MPLSSVAKVDDAIDADVPGIDTHDNEEDVALNVVAAQALSAIEFDQLLNW